MYKCQHCGNNVPAHTSSILRVIETRPVTYPSRQVWKTIREQSGGPAKQKLITTTEGYGYETVKELRICPTCNSNME